MELYAETIITPKELESREVLNKEIILTRCNIIIKGKVFNLKKEPIKDAVIFIKSVNYSYKPPKVMHEAYVITNACGEYVINIKKKHKVIYKLDIYEPIIKPKL